MTASLVHNGVVQMADLDAEALRLGRFRRHPSGTWSARFVLDPGPSADSAIDHIEELAVCMGRAGGLESDDAVFEMPKIPGTYEYICQPHALMMRGTLRVSQ